MSQFDYQSYEEAVKSIAKVEQELQKMQDQSRRDYDEQKVIAEQQYQQSYQELRRQRVECMSQYTDVRMLCEEYGSRELPLMVAPQVSQLSVKNAVAEQNRQANEMRGQFEQEKRNRDAEIRRNEEEEQARRENEAAILMNRQRMLEKEKQAQSDQEMDRKIEKEKARLRQQRRKVFHLF